MTVTMKRRLTAEEFFALLPGEQPNTQLVDGEIIVNAPRIRHQRLIMHLLLQLGTFAESHPGVGEAGPGIDLVISDHDVYVPDVWWTTGDHLFDRDAVRSYGPTDLAIEVRSPGTWSKDTGIKKDRYEAAGLPELWLVDTVDDRILVHRRSSPTAATFDVAFVVGVGDTLTTPLIPRFALDVTALFDR